METRRNRYRNKRKQKRRWIFKVALVLLFFIGGFLVYTGYNLFNSIKTGFNEVENTVSVDPNFKKFSILLMGIDENESRKLEGQTRENSRTDSLIYISVNKDNNRMDMVSIPRDSLTLMRSSEDKNDKNAYFFDKITHAYAYGGIDGTIEATSNLLNAPINFYAVINFEVFEQVIDSLGGVELYVPFDMVEQNANGEQGTVELKKGWHTLNGEKALAFARSRYYDSDIERGQRQLQVIHAVIDKAKSLNALSKVNDLIKIGGDNVTHNMTASQIMSAASILINGDVNIVSHRIDGYDAQLNGIYYYYPRPLHLLYISSVLNNSLGNDIPTKNDILNIYYQGYISPLDKKYKNKVVKGFKETNLLPVNYVDMYIDDIKTNIPEKLTLGDLALDPTVSNENKPIEESNKNNINN
ncbi:LCP family protein [Gemelliphila palaticanis]|uniref:LCP family protein n=1 Tax=Gemelliphila palaticanis TaxID=81950 RepID=A0ABX2SZC3_9BACL|nr:LCP family protein [Gemella palaticanis]MBF0715492.1 LCP family protein [Gemella palaticanis]NYS47422.1 LCP family protein [Gemella palaticanis]